MQVQKQQIAVSDAMAEIIKMAEITAKSGLFGVKDATQAAALMLLCQAENLHPMVACREYHVIQGRAALSSQAMLSRFLRSGGKQEILECTETKATVRMSHAEGGSITVTWTIDQAQRAGLAGKDNWKNHPRSMLMRRAQAEAIRAIAPWVAGNIMTEAEAEDVPQDDLLEPLNVTSLTVQTDQIALPSESTVDYPLDPGWPRDAKARIGREAERLGGKVDKKTAKAIIPESLGAEFEAFVLEVLTPATEEVVA